MAASTVRKQGKTKTAERQALAIARGMLRLREQVEKEIPGKIETDKPLHVVAELIRAMLEWGSTCIRGLFFLEKKEAFIGTLHLEDRSFQVRIAQRGEKIEVVPEQKQRMPQRSRSGKEG